MPLELQLALFQVAKVSTCDLPNISCVKAEKGSSHTGTSRGENQPPVEDLFGHCLHIGAGEELKHLEACMIAQ